MTLFLVRHGRATAGVEEPDPGLDSVGASQAEHAARALLTVPARRLVCSPLRRARETAAPIAALLGLSVEIREEVSEVFDPRMTADERTSMLGTFLSGRWSEQTPTLVAWRDRVIETLVGLDKEHTIVVSHFVAISAAIGASTGDDRIAPCPLANASITTMEVVGSRLQLRRPGEVAHLPKDEITATNRPLPGRK